MCSTIYRCVLCSSVRFLIDFVMHDVSLDIPLSSSLPLQVREMNRWYVLGTRVRYCVVEVKFISASAAGDSLSGSAIWVRRLVRLSACPLIYCYR